MTNDTTSTTINLNHEYNYIVDFNTFTIIKTGEDHVKYENSYNSTGFYTVYFKSDLDRLQSAIAEILNLIDNKKIELDSKNNYYKYNDNNVVISLIDATLDKYSTKAIRSKQAGIVFRLRRLHGSLVNTEEKPADTLNLLKRTIEQSIHDDIVTINNINAALSDQYSKNKNLVDSLLQLDKNQLTEDDISRFLVHIVSRFTISSKTKYLDYITSKQVNYLKTKVNNEYFKLLIKD